MNNSSFNEMSARDSRIISDREKSNPFITRFGMAIAVKPADFAAAIPFFESSKTRIWFVERPKHAAVLIKNFGFGLILSILTYVKVQSK